MNIEGGVEPKRREILERAGALTCGAREEEYGPPAESFGRVAVMWGGYLGVGITAADVCALLVMLKLSRGKVSPEREDSWVDAAGYAALAGEVATRPRD